jgi:hypothetical protein
MNWTNFLCIGFYDGEVYQDFLTLRDFFSYLTMQVAMRSEENRRSNRKSKKIFRYQIFAHFGGKFDFNFLLEYLLFEGKELGWEVGTLIPRGSGLLALDVSYFEEYKDITNKIHKTEVFKISFNDSGALLPFKLKTLTEDFDVPHKKGEWDHKKTKGVTPELLEYLESDCKGLWEVLKKYFAWPLFKKSGYATTMASQALKTFRTFLDQDIMFMDGEHDAFARQSYYGGRTEIYKPYFNKADHGSQIHCVDVNSLYPSIMRECEMPIAYDSKVYEFVEEEMGIYHVDVEVPDSLYIPPLGTRIEIEGSAKYIFPTGKFTGHWTSDELIHARSLGCKILKVHEGMALKNGGHIFKEYIEELYEIRLEANKRGDLCTSTIAKLLMNSLYGRMGIITDRENIEIDDLVNGEPYAIINDPRKGKYSVKSRFIDKHIQLSKISTELNTFKNVSIATWVTANARIKMMSLFKKLNYNIWYTDTDSAFTPENIVSSKELGEFKLEYSRDRAVFLLPKTYLTESDPARMEREVCQEELKKVVMKGFAKDSIKHFTFEDFQNALEGEMRVMKAKDPLVWCKFKTNFTQREFERYVVEQIGLSALQPEKMSTFKSALRKQRFVSLEKESPRSVASIYDKRVLLKNSKGEYDTRAWHIKDGEAV